MTLLLFFGLIGVNLWLAHKKQYSKIVAIVTLIAILLLMAGAGRDYATENRSMDYLNYERRYNNIDNVDLGYNIQFGYTIIQKIGMFLGLDFFWFRFVIIGLCLFALYFFVIKKYTANANYVLAFYLMYPMIIDSEQLRNFVAMTIVLSSVSLLRKQASWYKLMYLGLIGIAGTFHTAFLFYIPLIFLTDRENNRFAKGIAGISILLMGMMFLNNNQVPFAEIIMQAVDDTRFTRYLSSSTNLGFVMPLTLTLSSIILVFWAKKISDSEKNLTNRRLQLNPTIKIDQNKVNFENNFITLVFWINLLSSFFFPLFMITLQFYRLPRNLLLLNIAAYALATNKLSKDSLHRLTFNVMAVGSMALWLFIDLVVTTSADRVLIPFFTNNSFFN